MYDILMYICTIFTKSLLLFLLDLVVMTEDRSIQSIWNVRIWREACIFKQLQYYSFA